MDIREICRSKRDTLIERWVQGFFSDYSLDSKGFLRTRRDRFANPVGETTRLSAAVLFDAVVGEDVDSEVVKRSLHDLLWIRAVQDMPPSRAVGALCLLKNLLRSEVLPQCQNAGAGTFEEYLVMESRVDTLLLLALDQYAEARERVFRIRVEEIKQSQSQLIRLAKLRGEQISSAPATENEG